LPSVNASITKFERLKYQKTISGVSATDEAFALLMVVNYEARWTSQYEAIAGYPAESRKIRAKRWKDACTPPVLKDADVAKVGQGRAC
jgi:hypothetical protein